jgi:transcriptional regulator with XRE-family HTH domain
MTEQPDEYKRKWKGAWTLAGDNPLIIRESDKRMIALIKSARKAAGISQGELGKRLHISERMVRYAEQGDKRAWGYIRYTPKLLAWLKACSCGLRITITPTLPEPKERKKKGL